jgi:hypothetical protein
MSRIRSNWRSKPVASSLIEHWRAWGCPDYAQFDNDTIFQGAHVHPDTFGRITRLCLSLQITPVFVPPRESSFQAAIENYNGRWQSKVWHRFTHDSRQKLAERSDRYVNAARRRAAPRIASAPDRHPFPENWELDLSQPLQGTIIFLRRSDERGCVSLLGHSIAVSETWCHRLVRCQVDLTHGAVRFYRLRRREPSDQPLLHSMPYQVPNKPFQG